MKVAYHLGKGGKLVPLLCSADTLVALRKLISHKLRKTVEILNENTFVFTSTKWSSHHFIWKELFE